ncbi:MAG: DNA polymerase III subunit gamma/tau [Pseudomonadota bacterium]|nr:DNA polymerase III subunit gamma/tau [Pseudomonadota bacterium]MDP1904114.1 DNA polymerase III subunit gamma/tau [Pseudomonadota bacterium]MDP2354250.1 DNA polymerase III subunit gamma/tau [Pseudomonadota bacterium]
MSHQVLARKWRPKRFDQLVGQEHVVRALSNALATGRLHHAYLFTGTRGVGKTTLARILAKCLNCIPGVTPEPCGECAACREIDSGRFVDLIEIDAASNTGIDNMREVIDNAQYAPTAGRYKVYIIDEVHMLSKNAFNAMLKTLEEPPGHVIFILATTDPQKVPVTVLSRCLQFNLKQMPPGHVAGHLKNVLEAENVPFETGAINLLARAAAGSMRDALSLTDQAIAYGSGQIKEDDTRAMLGVIDQAYLMPVLEALADGDGPCLMNEAAELAARGFSFDAALQDLAGLLHQVALALAIPEAVSEDAPERERLFELAARLDPERVQVLYQIATLGRRDLEWAPDEYAGFSMTLLRMLAFAPSDSPPQARAMPPETRPAPRPEPRPAPVATRPAAPPPPWDQAANEAIASVAAPAPEGRENADWRALAESLPGATRQLAMQCERLGHNGNKLWLRLPENQKTLLDNFGDKLKVALAEKLGAGLQVEFELAAATDQSPAAARAREQAARQAEAEAAIHSDPFVQTLVRECDAMVANIRATG